MFLQTRFLIITIWVVWSGGFVQPRVQAQAKPVIKIVATGGTIANTVGGRVSIQTTLSDIRNDFPTTHPLLDSVELEIVELMRVGSQDFTGNDFLNIARTVNQVIAEPSVRGVVVTQGTYSTEETAYFLHLLVKSDKPVVIASSQRPHGSVGNDGDKNLIVVFTLERRAATHHLVHDAPDRPQVGAVVDVGLATGLLR